MEKGNSSSPAGERILSFIERIERLEKEKKEIADLIKEVKSEARGVGFDVKTIERLVRLRKKTPDQRAEEEALLDIYKAAIGMLDGTPLGEAAIRRLSQKKDEPATPDAPAANAPAQGPAAFMPDVTLEKAREMGAEAAKGGVDVIANPFPARDPRRAAWDEAWCHAKGNDGMDIPDAWKPKKPAKPPEAPPEDPEE